MSGASKLFEHFKFISSDFKMSYLRNCLILLAVISSTISFPGEYIPKSYYVIDQNGHKSDVVYFRSKRDVELFPLLRFRRGGGSSSSAHSSASASSSSSSGGGNGGPVFFGDGFLDGGFAVPNFANFAPGGGHGGVGGGHQAFASASSSSSSGIPGHGGVGGTGYNGPILFSRFGEDTGTGVHVSGSAQGERGAFSSSSSSIDSDGKIKYSVQSGKY